MSLCRISGRLVAVALNNQKLVNSSISIAKNGQKLLQIREASPSSNSLRNLYTGRQLCANISFNLTDIGEGIREVVVKEWFVKVGDKVSQFDNICEVQSDKASVTITSRYDGVISKLHYKLDETAYVGKPLIDIETEDAQTTTQQETLEESSQKKEATEKVDSSSSSSSSSSSDSNDYDTSLCIPSVRRLAKEKNVNLSKVTGTGKNGRILKEDVLKYLEHSSAKTPSNVLSQIESGTSDRVEPLTPFTKAMVKSMTESLKIPHFGFCEEITITNLVRAYETLKNEAAEENVKLTLMSLFVKATSNALFKFPLLNASLDQNMENVIYKGAHNISIAMDTKMGLAVPVIKNVNKLSILEIGKEISRLSASGKKGQFSKEDLSGGTFCISNIGSISGTYAHPIIALPQVAIIVFGQAKVLPRFDSSNNIVAEKIVNISGSADHRIIDGATVARFIAELKRQIENPYLLLFRA